MSDYIPREDSKALIWMQNLRDNVNADPTRYGLQGVDAASITSVVDEFQAKFTIASNEMTRTKGTVAEKDDARSAAESLLRTYAVQIKYDAGVTDQSKIDIGIRPINPDRDPIEPPSTSPLLSIIGNTPGSQTLRYSDSMTPDSRAKPFAAANLQLFRAITDEPTTDVSQAQFYGAFTKNPIGVGFDGADDGKVATYFGRWASAKGDVGPWSVPLSMRIAA